MVRIGAAVLAAMLGTVPLGAGCRRPRRLDVPSWYGTSSARAVLSRLNSCSGIR